MLGSKPSIPRHLQEMHSSHRHHSLALLRERLVMWGSVVHLGRLGFLPQARCSARSEWDSRSLCCPSWRRIIDCDKLTTSAARRGPNTTGRNTTGRTTVACLASVMHSVTWCDQTTKSRTACTVCAGATWEQQASDIHGHSSGVSPLRRRTQCVTCACRSGSAGGALTTPIRHGFGCQPHS